MAISAATFGTPYTPNNVSYQPMQTQGVQAPMVQMRSTSAMKYSGSTLPMAAATGTYTTNNTQGGPSSGPRRAKMEDSDDDGWEDEDDPENPGEYVPIGDAVWPLMVMIGGYGMLVYFRRKRIAKAKG